MASQQVVTQQVVTKQVETQQVVTQHVVTQQVVTQQVKTQQVRRVASDVCERYNSFEIVTVRRQMRGQRDTLTSRCCDILTTTKQVLAPLLLAHQ